MKISRGGKIQAGVLAGIGLGFIGAPALDAAPPPDCIEEHQCTFKKPRLLFVLDYGTAMNGMFDAQQTRWQAAVADIEFLLDADNGFLVSNFVLGLMRYGHDADGNNLGTTIPGDTTGLVDGVALDVPFYDPDDPEKQYLQCDQGDAIRAALDELPPPMNGIGSWTRGALEFAGAVMKQADLDHPEDVGPNRRIGAFLVVTQGIWTNRGGAVKLGPPQENPTLAAQPLYDEHNFPTYVLSVGGAPGKAQADALAFAGGTVEALTTPQPLLDAQKLVIQELVQSIGGIVCTPGYPRLMILLDASSGMLNSDDGSVRAPPGVGGWDVARAAVAGPLSLLRTELDATDLPLDAHLYTGLAVFGDDAPAEERLLVQYTSCAEDNRAWALDPATSCDAPGCQDPYAAPPVTWTFKNGAQIDPPDFEDDTLSHMPRCDLGLPGGCAGSDAFLHRGLELVRDNIAAYKVECADPNTADPCHDGTVFMNLLISEGLHDSADAEVQVPLEQMHAAGVTTYVLAVGDRSDTPAAKAKLAKLAAWGSGGALQPFTLATQSELEQLLVGVVEDVDFDPCCPFSSCSGEPPNEPDPMPPGTSTGTASESSSSETSATDTSSMTDTSSTSGTTTTSDVTTATDTTDPTTTQTTTEEPSTTTDEPTTTDTPSPTSTTTPPTTEPSPTLDDDPVPPDASGESTDSTGDDADTRAVPDPVDCDCSSTDPAAAAPALLVLLLGRRRRRTSDRSRSDPP